MAQPDNNSASNSRFYFLYLWSFKSVKNRANGYPEVYRCGSGPKFRMKSDNTLSVTTFKVEYNYSLIPRHHMDFL